MHIDRAAKIYDSGYSNFNRNEALCDIGSSVQEPESGT